MSSDQQLPNITVGRDADDETADSATVKYLNYERVPERGWDLTDDDLFEKAAEADLPAEDYGTFECPKDRNLLSAAEDAGYTWPFECRAASCANCAVVLVDGEVEMEMDMILEQDEIDDRDIRLACQSLPVTDEVSIVYNAKHLDYLQDRVIGHREV